MNDFMEIEHGIQLMIDSIRKPVDGAAERGLRVLHSRLNVVFPKIAEEAFAWFDRWADHLRFKTYVACLSEHDASEDAFGRLSMWRSYTANQVGVGLVIKPLPLYSLAENFGAFSSPVYYLDEQKLHDLFVEIAQNIEDNHEYVASRPRNEIKSYFCLLLRVIAMCTKHPGFVEEKEWRIMHTEDLDVRGALNIQIECVGGIPQPIFKIKLEDHIESGMTGISIPALVEKILIGPTQFPTVVRDAISTEMKAAGILDADEKISYAGIPVRT